MIILGIDPGTTRPGFGIIQQEGNQYRVMEYGLIEQESVLKKLNKSEKLLAIFEATTQLIKKYCPDFIGIETLFFSKNVSTAFAIVEMRSIVLLTAIQQKVPIFEINPKEVKLGITGKATADKKQVAFMVQKILGITEPIKLDDITDALAIAISSAHLIHYQQKTRVR